MFRKSGSGTRQLREWNLSIKRWLLWRRRHRFGDSAAALGSLTAPFSISYSRAHGECCLVAEGYEVLIGGGRGSSVPPVPEEQGQPHRPGEEEVDAGMAAGSTARGV